MLWQVYIFDNEAANLQLQKTYLANALVNLCGLSHIFYKIDLLLKHQKDEFQRFYTDKRSSLKETNQMFKQYTLLVDALSKV